MRLNVFWAAIFISLFIFIFGFRITPFWSYWGADIQCLHAFHNCPGHQNSPYLVEGSVCGDLVNRPMVYPPLHYWFFSWTRLFNFKTTAYFWSIFIALSLILSFLLWCPKDLRTENKAWLLWGLLIVQFPTLFHMERGSNEIPVILWFVLSLMFYLRKNWFWSAFFLSFCALTKVYPIVLLALVGTLVLWDRDSVLIKKWISGSVLGILTPLLMFPHDSWLAYGIVLPRHGSSSPPTGDDALVSHSILSLFPSQLWLGRGLYCLLLVWILFHLRHLLRKIPVFIFLLGLVVSNYIPSVAYDYQHILVYPLLFYLGAQGLKTKRWEFLALLLGGVWVYFFDRTVLIVHKYSTILTGAQLWWLALLVCVVPFLYRKEKFAELLLF